MFQPVESSVSFPKLEEQIIRFWKERGIYEKSLSARDAARPFVFYEGPPTANGLPHPGHCLTRAIKDLFPRYKTMRGYRCLRKAGWDTHGLPVEVEVCKELGIHSKEEIEAFGVEPFIRKCLESVFRYTKQWEHLTERLGFWIHLDDAYVTYHQSYVESVWWALKSLFDRGLLYQGHKIVWWWAQGGTALSSGEVGQGYREVADPAVFVRFPLVAERGEGRGAGDGGREEKGEGGREKGEKKEGLLANADLLVWTTTPWTLPSNQFAAVKPDLDYAVVSIEGEPRKLILAAALVEAVAAKVGKEFSILATIPGEKLIGLRYLPPYRFYYDKQGHTQGKLKVGVRQHLAWRVVAADFVTTDTGTGIVHQAPAFGEVDFDLLMQEQARFVEGEGPQLICSVAPDGTFTDETPEYKGRWVKDCDRDIIRQLKAEGTLFHQEQYKHDYPFCWRAEEDPLIQYPRKSWFIRTTALKDKMLANNRLINWLPEHIRDGRFGNFLETNVDWALSRERYWGTPLPIWVCEKTGRAEALGSYAELLAKPGISGTDVWEDSKKKIPDLSDHLKIHKPYIDEITYDSPFAAGARMRRVSEVIDCWFDSGAMPFAQWGYPHLPDSAALLADQFPADFISEALDQTRGWFYSLLAISTLLFAEGAGDGGRGTGASGQWSVASGQKTESRKRKAEGLISQDLRPKTQDLSPPFPHPFRNCIVLGLMLGEDGGKMSKSKRNYRDPEEIFSLYGADALRWYFFANQPPWTSIRYSEQAIKDCIPEFLLRLWNVYSFFVIYANIDGFDPAALCSATGATACRVPSGCGSVAGTGGQATRSTQPVQLNPDVLAHAKGYRPVAERGELDRWILGELNATAAAVVERMDAYDNFGACGRLTEFVDALSNWYVRRSRDRFWSSAKLTESADKLDAYWTLYECLLTTSKLIAPFVPFLSEAMWQNLAAAVFANYKKTPQPLESVHLCDYPTGDAAAVDPRLSEQMSLMREITSLGRSARMAAKLKVRQPLQQVEVVLAADAHREWLEEHAALIREELNVKHVEFITEAAQYVTYLVQPDLKRLGPRLGKRLPAVRKLLTEADGARLCEQLKSRGSISLSLNEGPVELTAEDVQIRLQARPGWAAAEGRAVVVVLSTELTEELIREGLARELVRAIQDRRKELDCQFTDRIAVGIETDAAELRAAVEQFADYISGETLAVELKLGPLPGVEPVELDIAGQTVRLYVKPQ